MRWTPAPVTNRADRERRDDVVRIPPREIPPPRVDRPNGTAAPQIPDVLARQQLHERAKAAKRREQAILNPPGTKALRDTMAREREAREADKRAQDARRAREQLEARKPHAERLGWVPCGPAARGNIPTDNARPAVAAPPASPPNQGSASLAVVTAPSTTESSTRSAPAHRATAMPLAGSGEASAPAGTREAMPDPMDDPGEGGSGGNIPTLAAPQHRDIPPGDSPRVGAMGAGQAADAAPAVREIPAELRDALKRLAAHQLGWLTTEERNWLRGAGASGANYTRLVVYLPTRVEWRNP